MYKLYGGAMGGGKSYALCAEGIALSYDYPANRGYLCRHELVSFKKTTLLTLAACSKTPAWLRSIISRIIISPSRTVQSFSTADWGMTTAPLSGSSRWRSVGSE